MAVDPQYLLYGAIFIAVLLLTEGLFHVMGDLFGSSKRRVNRRLSMLRAGRDAQEVLHKLRRTNQASGMQFLRNLSQNWGPVGMLDRLITNAGVTISTSTMMLVMAAAAGLIFAGGLALTGPLNAVGAGIGLGAVAPIMFLKFRRWRRHKKFGTQLPDTLDIIVRSLKAGHPISTALGMVADEMADPMGSEIGIAIDEMTYGLDLREALDNMLTRVGHADLQFMVAAVNIQHNVGGNLSEILAGLSRVIRDRFRMVMKIKALSAEGRISAIILSALPFVVFGFISLTRADYFTSVKDDPLFEVLMTVGAGLTFSGIAMMFKMVKFRI